MFPCKSINGANAVSYSLAEWVNGAGHRREQLLPTGQVNDRRAQP